MDFTDAASRFRVQVIASDTAKAYAGKPIDVKQIGKELGLRYLVRGSLQPTETRVRVSAQLIDGESGVQLWAETFDEDRADLVQMEDEIVARIMNALRTRVADIEAERAIRAQPGSPMALALLCAARAGDYAAETVDPEKRAELFKTCDAALRLDPHNAVALSVRTVWLLDGVDHGQSADREGDLRRANEDLTTLLAIDPNDPYANAYKVYLLRLEGRPDEAIAEGERSVALYPGFVHTYFYLCSAYIDAGQPEKAIDCVDKAIRLSPHDPSLYGLLMTKAGALEASDEKRRRWSGCAAVSLCRRRFRPRCVTRLPSSRSWGATTKPGKPTGATALFRDNKSGRSPSCGPAPPCRPARCRNGKSKRCERRACRKNDPRISFRCAEFCGALAREFPRRAETALVGVIGKGPLICPLATFAVAICNGSFTSTPVIDAKIDAGCRHQLPASRRICSKAGYGPHGRRTRRRVRIPVEASGPESLSPDLLRWSPARGRR